MTSIYEAFDDWLTVPTWSTSHALDERRFDAALACVAFHRDFSISGLRTYIESSGKAAPDIWGKDTRPGMERYLERAEAYIAPAHTRS